MRGKTLWERESFAVDFYLNDGLVSRRCADWIWVDVCVCVLVEMFAEKICAWFVVKRSGVLNVLGILM